MAGKPRTAVVRFTVPFFDADPMQIVWHGNYLKYFELARDRLLCDAGIDMYRTYQQTGYTYPITRTQTKHIRPLRPRDEVECKAILVEFECRLVFDFELRNVATGMICVKGRTEQAAVRLDDWSLELRLPDYIRRALAGEATESSVPPSE
jgi:acyl-CoA thioester hydrolase